MKTLDFNELNQKQSEQLDEYTVVDNGLGEAMLFLMENPKSESVAIEVAVEEDIVVDYRIFDPYHTKIDRYTNADGWTNWTLGNVE